MALQSRPTFWIPNLPGILGTINMGGNLLLDANGKKVAYIFQVPKTGTINQIGFRTNTVTTGDTMKIGLQTVDTTNGNPTGTAYGGSSTITQVIAAADDNVFFTVTLGTGATATRGDVVAVVIEFNAFVAGSMNFCYAMGSDGNNSNFPYCNLSSAAGVWSKNAQCPVLYVKYSDNSVANLPGCYPLNLVTTVTFLSTSTPDEVGLKFRLPFPFTLNGFGMGCLLNDQDLSYKLYDSDGTTVLKSTAWKGPITGSGSQRQINHLFASSQNLLANTFYRLTLVPAAAVNNTSLRTMTIPEAVAMDQMDGGQDFHLTKRTDAGAWTDVTTERPQIALLISAFDDGVQTGGLLVNRGMSGGVVN